ncbi:type II toxin-antitoxin system ParD family antitoxin [Sphingosinicella sp. LHD-64]|uniref:ribbon-helix-helix domain-containing protein n=1 Tax=Sphingosinicella sp. LHD-64 TaxID=3072139 RepID=UPI00280E3829|nr:type II toxin-antitoxin system ParD family antitoxin [Sphingosinicella sp. LHD-64]MDQ8758323.1 type II toxin-antitoxin system ParD family antitoxin [Sphingosinicella sp. LHD-64]
MPARANKPVSVTLGPLGARAEARVKAGDYSSLSEVVRAGLRALEREEALLDRLFQPIDHDDPADLAWVRAKIDEALSDPRPPIPAEEVFARLNDRIADYKAKRGA